MQAFIVSIIAGCFFPILPVLAEFGLTNSVQSETLALTGIVYAAAVGMASRNSAIAIASFFFSTVCAVIYGAEKYGSSDHESMIFIKYGSMISSCIIYMFGASYFVERFGRHCVDDEPFLEF